jgi:competence protein ComEC
MCLWIIAFMAGLFSLLEETSTLHLPWGMGLGVLGCILLFKKQRWLRLISGFCVGIGYATLWVAWQSHQELPNLREQQTLLVQGYVVGLPTSDATALQFEFETTHLCETSHCIPHRSLLQLAWFKQSTMMNPGERWQLLVKVKHPHGFANPGGFDYELYQWQRGVVATGYVRPSSQNYRLPGFQWTQTLNLIREKIKEHLLQQLKPSASQGIVMALLLGDRSQVDPTVSQQFRDTGTSHLIAISGLHISLVAGFCFFLGKLLMKRYANGLLWIPAQYCGAFFALLGATAYSLLAGFSVSTQRAFVMVMVATMALLLKTTQPPITLLSCAALIVLLINPFSILSAGFWLSFSAVGMIFLLMAHRNAQRNAWQNIIRLQLGLFFCMMPLTFWYFQQMSLLSWFANFFAIPWTSFVVVPLCLLGGILLPWTTASHQILLLAQKSIDGLILFLNWVDQHNYFFHNAVTQPSQMLILALSLLLLATPRSWPLKWLGGVWLVAFFLLQEPFKSPTWLLRLTVLDVGQGLATVIETKHHTLLFDTGPQFSPGFDSGNAVIVPFLRTLRIHSLSQVLISHGDMDHRGGLPAVLAAYPHTPIMTSDPQLQRRYAQATFCERGEQWQYDGVNFDILYPTPNSRYVANNSSCVLRIRVGTTAILLPGDIERPAEQFLIEAEGAQLQAQILIAPHHGSKTSSTREFIRLIRPEVVVYPVGWLNRYGFPHRATQATYREIGAKSYQTSQTGAIQFILDANQSIIGPKLYRSQQQHLWNHASL